MLISQRPAKLHKDSLTQVNGLIAMKLMAPQDRKAVEDWIADCADDPGKGKEIVSSLASLKAGEGWAWFPDHELLERMKFPAVKTFDSSKTPEDGAGIKTPRELSQIDISGILVKLKDAVEKAKADDPRELRKQIAALQKELSNRRPETVVEKTIEVVDTKKLQELDDRLSLIQAEIRAELKKPMAKASAEPSRNLVVKPWPPLHKVVGPNGCGRAPTGGLTKCERAILTALAQRLPKSSSKSQIGILSTYSSKSGSFANALSSLRTSGYIAGRGDDVSITQAGLDALGNYESRPSGEALLSWWYAKLERAPRTVLEVLASSHPDALSKEEIGERSGYSSESGSFANALSTLRTLQLIEGRGELRASDDLFA
jgi:hypothetical protein